MSACCSATAARKACRGAAAARSGLTSLAAVPESAPAFTRQSRACTRTSLRLLAAAASSLGNSTALGVCELADVRYGCSRRSACSCKQMLAGQQCRKGQICCAYDLIRCSIRDEACESACFDAHHAKSSTGLLHKRTAKLQSCITATVVMNMRMHRAQDQLTGKGCTAQTVKQTHKVIHR